MTTLDEIEARFERADKAQDAYLEGRSIFPALTRSVACTGDVPKLVAALRAVEAVHQSDGHKSLIGPYCKHCISPIDGGPKLWPCPTVRAIQQALDG